MKSVFTKLAHQAKGGSEIPQGELLAKIEGLQCQADEFNRLRSWIRVLADSQSALPNLKKTNSLEARFTKLADEAKRESEIPRGELLAKIEVLQRQVDGNRVAELDAHFRELTERVGELDKINSLEVRFSELANEAKRGPEIQCAAGQDRGAATPTRRAEEGCPSRDRKGCLDRSDSCRF